MRLEAKIKMGYYPTPLSVVERVRSFIRFPLVGNGRPVRYQRVGQLPAFDETFRVNSSYNCLPSLRRREKKGNGVSSLPINYKFAIYGEPRTIYTELRSTTLVVKRMAAVFMGGSVLYLPLTAFI
jgi:hypothetical protein